MRLSIKLQQLPPRLAAGAFLVNSGLQKLSANEEAAATVHGFATGTYPFLGKLKPADFTKALAITEITLGAALIVPIVPSAIAGAALTAFSGGLLGLYARTPGVRQPGSLRPTEQGVALAKDSWLAGIGLGMIIDDLTHR